MSQFDYTSVLLINLSNLSFHFKMNSQGADFSKACSTSAYVQNSPILACSRMSKPATIMAPISSQDIICAVGESRGISPTVGLAFVNVSTSEAILCQICDSQTYVKTVNKIGVFEPTEIVFMSTSSDQQSTLYSIVNENISDVRLSLFDRRHWSEKACCDYVEMLAFPDEVESIKVSLEGKFYASTCLAAVRSTEFSGEAVHSLKSRL
jgi:DNA mismatch repair protein MSH4